MSVPTNAIILVDTDNCPSGFSDYTDLDGYFWRVEASPDLTPSGSNSHTHSSWDHTHTYSITSSGALDYAEDYVDKTSGTTVCRDHTHTISITSDFPDTASISTDDHIPNYAKFKICKKD